MVKINVGADLQKVIQTSQPVHLKSSPNTSNIDFKSVVANVERMFADTGVLDKNFEAQIKALNPKLQNLFELQRTAHKINFSTEILSKSTEALSSSFRRIQQMA